MIASFVNFSPIKINNKWVLVGQLWPTTWCQGTKDHTLMLHEQPARLEARCRRTFSHIDQASADVFTMIWFDFHTNALWTTQSLILKLTHANHKHSVDNIFSKCTKKNIPHVHNSSRKPPAPGKTVVAASPKCSSDLPARDINFSSASVETWGAGSHWQRPFPNPQPSNPVGHLLHLFGGGRLL